MRATWLLILLLAHPGQARAHLLDGGGEAFSRAGLDPAAIALLLAAAWCYLRGIRWMKERGSPPSAWRRRCFWTGWALLFLALGSPLDALGEELFTAHMLQHEIMMLLAAPLLVMSRPTGALLRGGPQVMLRAFSASARTAPVLRGWRWLVTPFSAWTLHLIVLWGWHLPALFEAGLNSDVLHALQHLSFLLVALLFWWALLRGALARGGAGLGVLYLFTTAVHASLLGALLTFSPRVWYPSYIDTAPAWGLSALEDQQLGGLIMWMPAGVVFILAALVLLARALRDEPREGEVLSEGLLRAREEAR